MYRMNNDKLMEVFNNLDGTKDNFGIDSIDIKDFSTEEIQEALAVRSCVDESYLTDFIGETVRGLRDDNDDGKTRFAALQIYEINDAPDLPVVNDSMSGKKKLLIAGGIAGLGAAFYFGIKKLRKKKKDSDKKE